MTSLKRRLQGRFATCGLALLAACGSPADEPAGTDLLSQLAGAERWSETTDIDLGDAPEPALLGGWAAPSRDASDYLWSAGGRSELEFRRVDRRAFEIDLRGWAHPRLPAGQSITVELNGTPLGTIHLAPEPSAVTIAVPAQRAVPGVNRLTLAGSDLIPTGAQQRLLGAAWDRVRFSGAPAGGTAETEPVDSGLALAGGSGIDYFVELEGEESLRLRGIRAHDGAHLGVDLACEGQAPRYGLLESKPRGTETVRLPGDFGKPALCRLTVRAVPEPGSRRPGAVTVESARLISAPQPVSEARSPKPLDTAKPPSFAIYLVDALRADRIGGQGYARPLSPAIDRFATGATYFETARAQTSWTRPAVATMLTGLTPLRHGATDTDSVLPGEVITLAERLRERGYRSAYVTANGNTTSAFGFDQGLDRLDWLPGGEGESKAPWTAVNAAALEFLDTVPAGAPFLLILHTVETHAPYRPAPAHRARWAAQAEPSYGERPVLVTLPGRPATPRMIRDVVDLYDAEVASADEGFGAFLVELERRGRRAETSVIFTSDHGEELFEHGYIEHGRTLYEEQLRVPLVWAVPGVAGGRRIAAPIEQIDLLPTILELAGLASDPALPGRSFAAALRGGAPPAPRASAAWLDRLTFHQESVADGGYKLIRDFVPRSRSAAFEEALFDLADDPAELRPLEPPGDLRLRSLRARLRGWAARSGPALSAPAAVLDERLREELGALGYLQ